MLTGWLRMLTITLMLFSMSGLSVWVFSKVRFVTPCAALALLVKKTLQHPKADVALRTAFQLRIKTWQAKGRQIIYLDESGFAHDMPRTHGYTPRGERCYGQQDWQARGRTNVIGALNAGILSAVCLCLFNIDSEVFHSWVVNSLLPSVREPSVIVMDNASFHQRRDTQEAIRQAGHILEYLPPYSPDLNPIEHKWAQAKAIRRKHRCSIEEIFQCHSL